MSPRPEARRAQRKDALSAPVREVGRTLGQRKTAQQSKKLGLYCVRCVTRSGSAAAHASPAIETPEGTQTMNIILLISDTFRYDNLFDRSDEMPVNTPNLDRFAERAVSCSRMFMSSFPTIPHRTDVTTGRYGWPWYSWQDRLKSSRNHVPIILGSAGYASQLITDCPHLYNSNFHSGFTAAQAIRGQEGDMFMLRLNHPIEEIMPRE